MAPLLLLFLLGGLCALFSLTTASSRAGAGANNKCDEDVRDGGCVTEEAQPQQGKKKKDQAPAAADLDKDKDLGIVFSTFDHDGDGFITAVELEESLRRLGIAVSADEAAAMVARVDANSDGLIDIHEFRELYDSIPKKRKHQNHHQHPAAAAAAGGDFSGAAREVPVEGEYDDDEEAEGEEEEDEERDLREAFDVFDGNKDGLISAEELGTVLGSLGLRRQGNGRAAVADCRDMIRLVDSDGDGMVSFEEFKRMMTVVKA